MPLKNTVAVERRMDLASLFCMISRHGPAVALAVVAMVSVLAAFIIYRTVRGKRRKATAAAADGDSKSRGEERDATVIQSSPEESHSSPESTDLSDEGPSNVKEDADLSQSDLKIRHRRAAAAAAAAAAVEKKPPPYSPPIKVPEDKHITSDDTVVWDSYKVAETYTEEASEGLLTSDTHSVAEMVAEDAVDCQQGATDETVEDVMEEVCDNYSCLRETELINDDHNKEDEKVVKAECQEDEDVTTDKDDGDKSTRQEEENLQRALNNAVLFEQAPQLGEMGDSDRLQDNAITLETNSNPEESVIHIEDVPAPLICFGKDEEFEEVKSDNIDYSSYSSNNGLSPEEEKKDEGETAEEEFAVYQVIPQQAEICSSTSGQETNQPATQQDQSDHVMDPVTQPICDSDWIEDGGQAREVIEDAIKEDQLNKLEQTVEFDNHLPYFDEQQVEQNEENSLACNQEDIVLNNGADLVKDTMLMTDIIVEEHDSSNVALPCLSTPVKVDNHDDGLSCITTDAKEKTSGIAEFPDLWLDCQQPQKKEEDKAPSLDEVTDSTILGPQLPSHETENQPENKGNGMMALAEECNDEVYDHQQDQQSVQMIDIEVVDKVNVPADPSTVQSITPSVIVEEMSCPQLPSICQDQESNYMEHDETFVVTRINSATDAPACDNATITSPIMSEEISHPDILSSSQDQQGDQTKEDEDFSEVTTGAVSVMPEDIILPICQIHSLSLEQSELRDDGVSSPGVGDESGISSMAVSPDAGNEFDVVAGNMVLPVIDCELQSEGRREDKISLFADDIAVSVINGVTAGMVFGPYPSPPSKVPSSEPKDWTNYESFAANEDMLGHEIEDAYHREMDQIMAQITANASSFTNELKIQTDMKIAVEVVEIKEMKAGVSAEKKKDAKAEEKEEDFEKTEISIMEATMDNNEWITESNYPVLPWLIPSAPSFPQDHTKTNQPPTEECQHSSAVTDSACVDTTDIPSCNEVKQTSTISLVDENMENNKRVVAVQPMPQNVNVTFRIHYFTQSPYQTVAVTGNQQELGNWKEFIPLERAKDGHWSTVVSLPAESHVEWKFVVLDKGEVCRWEECGNRLLDTGYGDDLLVHKWWGHL